MNMQLQELILKVAILSAILICSSEALGGNAKSRLVNRFATPLKIPRRSHLFASKEPNNGERKIVRYDNLGEPIYEDELDASSSGSGISILGNKVSFDPLTASLIIFGLIAFNFFVLANL
jgi:hypothetical protein